MIAGLGVGSDLRRYFHFTLPRIAIVTIIIMPLMYGALYLYTFWNPFNEVNKIPVAIVNLDKGTTLGGQQLAAGDQVTKTLIDSGQLDLTQVDSKEQAMKDLEKGKFYFFIEIPEDFSSAVASPIASKPRAASLTFHFNDANSYLSTVLGQDAAGQVVQQVNTAIAKQSLSQVLVAVAGDEPKLDEADAGAAKLASGLKEAHTASGKLKTGSAEVSAPLVTAAGDVSKLQPKVNDLVKQVNKIAKQQEKAVSSSPIPGQVAKDNAAVKASVDNAVKQLKTVDDPVAQKVATDLAAVSTKLGTINKKLDTLATQADVDVVQAIKDVQKAADDLGADFTKADKDINKLAGGSKQVASGNAQLEAGLKKLSVGADELANGFASVIAKVPNWTDAERDAVAGALTTPVLLQQDQLNEAPNFGTGFAPFFMSLALFVGGILTWMVLKPLRPRPVAAGVNPLRTAFVSYWPALIIGVLQVCVLYPVVLLIGLRPTHAVGMVFFAGLVSATFLAMIQMFNAVFGEAVGRVVTLAFLMLQLVSSGGIYPIQTTAGPIQALNRFDPMTYTVDGFRQLSVAHTVDSRLWVSIAVLASVLVVTLLITAVSARRDRVFTVNRLYPMVVV